MVLRLTNFVNNRPRFWKFAIDGVLLATATPIAFAALRGWHLTAKDLGQALVATALLFACKEIFYISFRIQSGSWATHTFDDMWTLGMLGVGAGLTGTLVLTLANPTLGVASSLSFVDALVALALLATVRAVVRFQYERTVGKAVAPDLRRSTLIIGAGQAGAMTARELARHPETGLLPIGFLDDDKLKHGIRVAGLPVLGSLEDAPTVIRDRAVDEVLVAIPSDVRGSVRRVVEILKDLRPRPRYKVVPGMYEVLSGKVDVHRIRDVDISDLLGRPPVSLDVDSILGYLAGKRVMVTGAGGSIGSELVRQICRFQPHELILFGHGENSIYALERELDQDWPGIRYTGVIGAIQNRERLDYVFSTFKPHVVFHAAAHKHVPLMEQNPEEAVFNNIIGSRNLIDMAVKHEVSHFVNISTDKAVNPASVMGASKRMVEHLVHEASDRASPDQAFVSVRFGNVLGSRGSVIPIFKRQIMAGGPVTVTDPDMVRYFMTIPEAARLVLQASALGRNGDTYILDMGEPVRIVDLARDLIRLSGLEPDVDIPIVFTGARPGEKLAESLLTDVEQREMTSHEKIFVTRLGSTDASELHRVIDELQKAALVSDHDGIRHILQTFLEGCSFKVIRRMGAGDAVLTPNPSAS